MDTAPKLEDPKKMVQVQQTSGQLQQQSNQIQVQIQVQNPNQVQTTPASPAPIPQQPTQVQQSTSAPQQQTTPIQPPATVQIQPITQVQSAPSAQIISQQPIQLQHQPQQLTTQIQPSPQIQQLAQSALVPVSTSQPSICAVAATTPPIVFQLTHPRGIATTQIRPQGTLTMTPTTATTVQPTIVTPAIIKAEPNKYICCLLDNGIRCDRVAGNASFSARIQKIVGTKKMNYALDPTVRHAYICEHHKAIITVAKKSTAIARAESKANAKNYNTPNNNNVALAAAAAASNNIAYTATDLSRRQQQTLTPTQQVGGIATLQHPVNLEIITNPNQRLANNHHPSGATLSTIPIVRQGTQIAYGHFQPGAVHPNQYVNMDVLMSNSSFDNTGGDNVSNNVGPSSSGIDVDLQQLQVNTLRRYKRHFRVQTKPGLNKMQLAESLKSHFRTLPIIEKEAITYFVYIVKCYRNKLDHNPAAD